ncbi:dipeptide/oligopeptide/nickel ABC transporter permease/ATP-binding protein [Glutamicibacter sp. MNS18]|uniref:dipeptide/oligopeptide/nickel ABC transporter permease/ATP-binding protein n=1 Tax=Glutamicibacter sp. MNS18 TaxID=2989817 RepID=UPI002235FF43|nr:dipeptide/oligopeptide/nickel ABC transporter permease/ATP-binding protein [Glutamicibacter sp. MNS18]MCW4465637.1 dipeptide/oligopeptide/nickel ABC transporter permease/ATP-binding protein [Glutamicibacter sp. MNS18]
MTPLETIQAPKQRRRIRMNLAVGLPSVLILTVILMVALAPLIAPHDPLQQDLSRTLQRPDAQNWLGTDSLGRDIFSRLLYGGQPALLGVALALTVFLLVGVLLGVLAGYLGGLVDRIVGVVVDMFMALPNTIIILAVLAVFSQSQPASMITLGVLASANLTRVVRGAVLAIRGELYVDAAMVSGLTDLRIMSRHIVPGVVGPVLVQLSIFSGVALSVQTGLGFLGVASKPPAPSWGSMVGEAAEVMSGHGYFLVITGGIIAVMTFAFGFLGDGLRDMASESRKQPAASLFRKPMKVTDRIEPPNTEARLSVIDYSIGFTSNGETTRTVKNIDLEVHPGEIVGLVGESGSGKSVTSLSWLGLLPSNGAVTTGQAFIDGVPLVGKTERELQDIRGAKIGLISQEPMVALDPSFTIGSQLGEVVRLYTNGTSRDIRTRCLQLLSQVQMPDPEGLLGKYPHELSGGMLQRVVIAIALAGSPRLLIADEPTTALDVTVQAEILDLLRHLRDTEQMSIVLVTHDLGVVADICERIYVMKNGEIVESGVTQEIFDLPEQQYTKTLIANTPTLVQGA